jgi:hypothetical protein
LVRYAYFIQFCGDKSTGLFFLKRQFGVLVQMPSNSDDLREVLSGELENGVAHGVGKGK